MGQNPEQNPNYYEGYRGGHTPPAPSGNYGSTEEQPQSSYQHPEGQQGQQSPYGTEQQYYQQQYEQQQQQQQQYNQQQQQQQQYNQYYQPPFSSTYSGGYGDAGPTEMSSLGISARLTALLSYLFSWVGGLIILLTEKQNQFVRFHAMQSIIFAVSFFLLQWAAGILPFVGGRLNWAIGVAGIIIWIVLMVKAYQGKYFKLPIIGDYAERFSRRIKI